MNIRVLLLILSIAVITVAGAILYRVQPRALSHPLDPVLPWNSQITLASSSENNVTVTLSLAKDSSGDTFLVGTFTPMQAGYHLYSKDLPRSGVQGIGRPTLLELADHRSIESRGPLGESVSAAPDPSVQLEQPLLIYPNGPVSLFLPIRLPAGDADALTVQVLVSYMTCSDEGLCTPPVEDKPIAVRIPSESGY